MRLKSFELVGFKSFAKKTTFLFDAPITAIVGPNGSGKSNVIEAIRWVLGEKSMKSLRGRRGGDLIFNGGAGLNKMNRAAATLTFDNESSLAREVSRDGANNYLINGAVVRFREVVEFLAAASLGVSSHFIINQGEVDRIINLNNRDRRALIEDALGLRFYQWKIELSEKKLRETEKNTAEAKARRQEIAPHLRFLKKQADKAEQAEKWRAELSGLYPEYLRREELYLKAGQEALASERRGLEAELAKVKERLKKIEPPSGADKELPALEKRQQELKAEILKLAAKSAELTRALGRLEGLMESERPAAALPYAAVADFVAGIKERLGALEKLTDLTAIKTALRGLREFAAGFLKDQDKEKVPSGADKRAAEKIKIEQELSSLQSRETAGRAELAALEQEIAGRRALALNAEHELLAWQARQKEIAARQESLERQAEKLKLESDNFERELTEAKLLIGESVIKYRSFLPDNREEPRSQQEERRRKIERLKIRLEDSGVESGETIKEYRELSERDEFLSRELDDLGKTAASLRQIIKELKQKIDDDFKDGLVKINCHFQEFFHLLFSGGTARLTLTKAKKSELDEAADEEEMARAAVWSEEAATEEGISIQVSLPRKKIRGLEMLSGGERALTSIALLFAMSQVKPPPFLVLDETDAALDESNSRRYGEMVENLAKHSQLILVTHNRETMAHAGILYGVTMGRDSASRLLSIRFDEAAAYAES